MSAERLALVTGTSTGTPGGNKTGGKDDTHLVVPPVIDDRGGEIGRASCRERVFITV